MLEKKRCQNCNKIITQDIGMETIGRCYNKNCKLYNNPILLDN